MLTDIFNNPIVVKLDELVSVRKEMSETVLILKTEDDIVVKETVEEVWQIINLRR
jgi:hypothetical protein